MVEILTLIFFSFFTWAFLHELAHATFVKLFVKNASITYKIYPHIEKKIGFVWASISWTYPQSSSLTLNQRGWISFAPRIIDSIGILLTIALDLLITEQSYKLPILILTGGSIFDLLWGSIGYNKNSDLRRYSDYWNWDYKWPRIIGISIGVIVFIVTILFF